jgi:hypothetical protein
MSTPEVYSPNSSNYTFIDKYDMENVPILKPNLVAPSVVRVVRMQQLAKAANEGIPYASYNTLTGQYCQKPQDPASAYQGITCAYSPHTYANQPTQKINPAASFRNVLSASVAQNSNGSQPKPSWYWNG